MNRYSMKTKSKAAWIAVATLLASASVGFSANAANELMMNNAVQKRNEERGLLPKRKPALGKGEARWKLISVNVGAVNCNTVEADRAQDLEPAKGDSVRLFETAVDIASNPCLKNLGHMNMTFAVTDSSPRARPEFVHIVSYNEVRIAKSEMNEETSRLYLNGTFEHREDYANFYFSRMNDETTDQLECETYIRVIPGTSVQVPGFRSRTMTCKSPASAPRQVEFKFKDLNY